MNFCMHQTFLYGGRKATWIVYCIAVIGSFEYFIWLYVFHVSSQCRSTCRFSRYGESRSREGLQGREVWCLGGTKFTLLIIISACVIFSYWILIEILSVRFFINTYVKQEGPVSVIWHARMFPAKKFPHTIVCPITKVAELENLCALSCIVSHWLYLVDASY